MSKPECNTTGSRYGSSGTVYWPSNMTDHFTNKLPDHDCTTDPDIAITYFIAKVLMIIEYILARSFMMTIQ